MRKSKFPHFITDGGVAGHMMALHEDPDLTFAKIKEILTKASQGQLEGTEKTDGQNVFLSYDVSTGEPRAARNKTDLKKGGMSAQALADKFAGRGSVETAYNESFVAWSKAVSSIPKASRKKIFGDGKKTQVWFNAEIQDPGNPNVINYDDRNLVIHVAGHFAYDLEAKTPIPVNVRKQAALLGKAVDSYQRQDSSEFQIVQNAVRKLDALDDKTALNNALQRLEREMKRVGISDDQTIQDYVQQKAQKIGAEVPRLKKDLPKFISNMVRPIEIIIHDFGVEMLKTLKSIFVLDQDKEVKRLQGVVAQAIKAIQKSENPDVMEILKKQLQKLKSVENIGSAAEGFVFNFDGKTYKFTGNFAPVNQLLGLFKYGRGKIPPMSQYVDEARAKKGANKKKILFPGAFKPPGPHHAGVVAQLSKTPGLSEGIIAISPKPREIPGGGEITAKQSFAVWKIYLKAMGIKNFKPMIAPVPSPVRFVYDYVLEQEHPPGTEVFLVVGEKDTKTNRFGSMPKLIQQKGLKVKFEQITAPDPGAGVSSASEMRKTLADQDKETFLNMLPSVLKPKDKDKVWSIISGEVNEMSAMGAGAVAGYAAPLSGKRKVMDLNEGLFQTREVLYEEVRIRREIHKLIQERYSRKVFEEAELRSLLSKAILREASSDTSESPHETTGINVLSDLLKKIIPQLETGYKSLTTSKEQRDSYRKHILNATQKSLSTADITDKADQMLAEDIDITVGDDEKFIDIEKDGKDDEKEDTFGLAGEDETGRNMAQTTFESVEKQILDAYAILSDPKDQKLFYDYLMTNLRLYFDKFEGELDANPGESEVQADDAEMADEMDSEFDVGTETDLAEV